MTFIAKLATKQIKETKTASIRRTAQIASRIKAKSATTVNSPIGLFRIMLVRKLEIPLNPLPRAYMTTQETIIRRTIPTQMLIGFRLS